MFISVSVLGHVIYQSLFKIMKLYGFQDPRCRTEVIMFLVTLGKAQYDMKIRVSVSKRERTA